MARVRSILSSELPPDLAQIYEEFASLYGPFRNQVAVFAHVPPALRHLMSMLMELRAADFLACQALEAAIDPPPSMSMAVSAALDALASSQARTWAR